MHEKHLIPCQCVLSHRHILILPKPNIIAGSKQGSLKSSFLLRLTSARWWTGTSPGASSSYQHIIIFPVLFHPPNYQHSSCHLPTLKSVVIFGLSLVFIQVLLVLSPQCYCQLSTPFHFHKTHPISQGPQLLHHVLLLQCPKWLLWSASCPPCSQCNFLKRARVKQVWLSHKCLMPKCPKSPLYKIICLALRASISSTNISLSTHHWWVSSFIYFDCTLHPKYDSMFPTCLGGTTYHICFSNI